jgi:hypothetical protein
MSRAGDACCRFLRAVTTGSKFLHDLDLRVKSMRKGDDRDK